MNNHYNFATSSRLIEELSKKIVCNLTIAIEEKGGASLLVSGGSTPKKLFEALSLKKLPWKKVTISLVDERWVDENHEDSNAKLVKNYLLQNNAKEAKFISLYEKGLEAFDAEVVCHNKMMNFYPFDVIILGMGMDGHTASLFPYNEKLSQGLDLNMQNYFIASKPETAPHNRMSLTAKAILDAQYIYLHIEGEEKLSVYKEALSDVDKEAMPIRAILNQTYKSIEVYSYK